ncbi:RNA-binding protein Rmd9p, mitochondrial [Diutina catenulata]
MFRLIQAQAGFRPVLTKVRGQALPRTSGITLNNLRGNHSAPAPAQVSPSVDNSKNRVDQLVKQAKKDPLFREAVDQETRAKKNHFLSVLNEAQNFVTANERSGPGARRPSPKQMATQFGVMHDVLMMFFDDAQLRASLSYQQIYQVTQLMRMFIKQNREARLSGQKNRDRDQRSRSAYYDENQLQYIVSQYLDVIASGELNGRLNPRIVQLAFACMKDSRMSKEMIGLWEQNITNDELAPIYMSQLVLATVLPVGYHEGRFTYPQVSQIYELNKQQPGRDTDPKLLSSMGQIAVAAGDYSRGLDAFEQLLSQYESAETRQKWSVLQCLCTIHLEFVRSCTDISIAKHFFDKIIHNDLPYRPLLKVDAVAGLMQNIAATGDMEMLKEVWITTLTHYHSEQQSAKGKPSALHSRFSALNSSFFRSFFMLYPQLTPAAHQELRAVLELYQNAGQGAVDETFLNNLISNLTWSDKSVFDQLVMYYDAYQVPRTQVSYRITLKKMGSIADASLSDIVAVWHQSLAHLDADGVNYIPVADWAALRDATIFANPKSEARTNLYLAIMVAYRNYHQDTTAVKRFVGNWIKSPQEYSRIAAAIRGKVPEVPEFVAKTDFATLQPRVDFDKAASEIISKEEKRQ